MNEKLLLNPPEKVLAMYRAVVDLINEGSDIKALKVSDITGRAGIGKGTAYEYFSSKEEIISSSVLYYVQTCVEKLKAITESDHGFCEKINEVMDFIDEHVKEKQGVFFLIRIVLESYGIPKNLKDEFEEVKRQRCESEKNEMLDNLVKAGVKEGLIREENVFLQRAALETQLSVYFMYCIATEKKMELDLEPGILRGYVYQNILKLLGQKSS